MREVGSGGGQNGKSGMSRPGGSGESLERSTHPSRGAGEQSGGSQGCDIGAQGPAAAACHQYCHEYVVKLVQIPNSEYIQFWFKDIMRFLKIDKIRNIE